MSPYVSSSVTRLLAEINASVVAHGFTLFILTVAGTVIGLGGGRAVRFWLQRHRKRLWYKRITNLRALWSLSWQEFEIFTGEYFREKGYTVQETGGGGRDRGRDHIIHKGTRRYIVQCKFYRERRVGVGVVREMAGVVLREQADGAIIVTVGRFTSEAKRDAAQLPVQLIDGETLLARGRRRSP